jgi:hypothetical protein
MKKYLVKTDCTFDGRYWDKGLVVDFEDDVVVPHHFELVYGEAKKPEPVKDYQPLSAIHKPPVIKTGMAYGMKDDEPQIPKTSGAYSRNKGKR